MYLYTGKIGITTDISWPEPKTDTPEDRAAQELDVQFYVSLQESYIYLLIKPQQKNK